MTIADGMLGLSGFGVTCSFVGEIICIHCPSNPHDVDFGFLRIGQRHIGSEPLPASPKWEVSHAHLPLRDRNDGAILKHLRLLGDDLEQMAIDILGPHVPQTKNEHTRQIGTTGCKEIAKVEIMRQEDVSFPAGLLQYLRVPQSMEALLLQVSRLMPQMLKEVNSLWGDTHVA
jgi:hypothetical protein